MRNFRFAFLTVLLLLFTSISIIASAQGEGGIYRAAFKTGGRQLTVEILDDDLAHFQLGDATDDELGIWTTPMVDKTNYTGPTAVNVIALNVIETPEMRLEIDESALCVTVTDISREPELTLTTLCPLATESGESSGLTFTQEGTTDLYGLGEQFLRRGGINGNWFGKRRSFLNVYGNELTSFNGGNVGNAQFPILYALGAATENYALFLDDVYQQYWDLRENPFSVTTKNPTVRWYIMTGADLPDLRGDYMELTGHPPVPPRQMFGLWVSEYGYESWDELEGVLDSLQAANFPLDGFVLDLQWFGGIGANGKIGGLAWDETNFPDPAATIAGLREAYGIGIMTIEESYVKDTLSDYEDVADQGVLARECGDPHCPPITLNAWWGRGGMVDWTNPEAAAWWHDNRRAHLIDEGVIGHWTDLGEPETFDEAAWYHGFPEQNLHAHADVHNLYNLRWSESIWDGYQRNGVERRPFILSRSGTSGTQRYGVAMWSGDIAANMISLEAHMNAQMHMSLSGVDYFGSDVGGFYRQVFDPVLGMEGMYTVWLANSVLLDVPLRPHAANQQNLYNTAPSLIGDVASNLANVRLRYALSPYLYTLAHRAYRDAEPIFAPLVYSYQDDPEVRLIGAQKMLGADMMMATITGENIETIPVYLPAGGWFNYYTGDYFASESGQWIDVSTNVDGLRRAPLFVHDGAIIPQMVVDDATLNTLGQREDGANGLQNLVFTVYQAENEGDFTFTLIEDDGQTMAYQSGDVRETLVTVTANDAGVTVTIGAVVGTYTGAPETRNVEVRLVSPDSDVQTMTVEDAAVGEPLEFTFGLLK